MAALTVLVPDIQAEIPEIPNFIAERQILRAAREFCEETRMLRVDLTVSTIASAATIDLNDEMLDVTTELIDVVSVKNVDGGRPVEARTVAWLNENTTDWRSEEALDATWYTRETFDSIRLVYTPSTSVANKYFVRVTIKPKMTATAIDDILINKYDETLIHGALGKLYMIPRKPWTDLNLGQYHTTMFIGAMPAATTRGADDHQTGIPRKVKYGGL